MRSEAERIRVCQLVATFAPITGGIQTATEQLCHSLRDRGIDVVVLTRRFPGTSRFESVEGLQVFRAGIPGRGRLSAVTFVLHGLALLAIRRRRYKILHSQNLDSPLLLGLLGKWLLGRELIVTVHTEKAIAHRQARKRGRLRLHWMKRSAAMIVAVNAAIQDRLVALGVRRLQLCVIRNGVDVGRFAPPERSERAQLRRQLGLPSGVVLIFVGRLIGLKRVDALLHAWAAVSPPPDSSLLLVGDGPAENALRRLASELALTGVHFMGNQRNVLPYLQASDVFVLPSESEGFPVALLEAAAVGLACIVSDLPGAREALSEKAALFVPADGVDALREALIRVTSSPDLRAELGRHARECATRRFAIASAAERHSQMYLKVLST